MGTRIDYISGSCTSVEQELIVGGRALVHLALRKIITPLITNYFR